MAHAYHHAQSSARIFGGKAEDYLHIHEFFDQTKAHIADARHRMVLHNSFGIFLCEKQFGVVITNSAQKEVPVRLIAEQHVKEDFGGYIPSLEECLSTLPIEPWMYGNAKALSRDRNLRRIKPDHQFKEKESERPAEQSK